jgi:hypothetical protein
MSERADRTRGPARAAVVTAVAVLTMIAAAPTPPAAAAPTAPLDAYSGPGTWVDIYDTKPLRNPVAAVDEMARRGASTLYLETANYRRPYFGTLANRVAVALMIDAAHLRGMRVVAWYLPSFADRRRDLARSLAAIAFTTPFGGRFDSFALDIEAGTVRSIARRNRRAVALSNRIRAVVGPAYPLGAIVPDRRSTDRTRPSLWPRFPYRRLRPAYDVFLPMSYSSYRGKGSRFVYRYTFDNVDFLRLATGDPALPVHVIGGLANRLGARSARAVVDAARDAGGIGTSFYKFSLSGREEWQALAAVR